MSEQLIVSLAIVAFAGSYLAWRIVGTVRAMRKGGCGGGCGCASKSVKAPEVKLIAPEELVVRRR